MYTYMVDIYKYLYGKYNRFHIHKHARICVMTVFFSPLKKPQPKNAPARDLCSAFFLQISTNTANLNLIDARYQLSTVFSTSLLPGIRWNHDNGRQLFWDWQYCFLLEEKRQSLCKWEYKGSENSFYVAVWLQQWLQHVSVACCSHCIKDQSIHSCQYAEMRPD